ncbi:aspartyl/glutamyl-tRNA amidotransferase subunit C [Candidatus Micrarchaeota archaeon]|nr:aspartyl/glutamyl-tRNA amidotransferase subunit C [Candidatus Micrarchaeota archaeon]
MKIDKKLVEQMAELSRIKLTDEEISRLEKEFSEMFEYFELVNEVEQNQSSTYINENKAQLRDNKEGIKEKEIADTIVGNFAQKDGRLMIAPKTL